MSVLGNIRDTKTNQRHSIELWEAYNLQRENNWSTHITDINTRQTDTIGKIKMPNTVISWSIIQRSLSVEEYKEFYIFQDKEKGKHFQFFIVITNNLIQKLRSN